MKYDSTNDTIDHIGKVQNNLYDVIENIKERADVHDKSKLLSPEKEIFDTFTPLLKNSAYGSDEYKQFLADMKPGLDHHYAVSTHHPEHFENGIDDMTLLDLIEMFCDWKAATQRHADGDFSKSLEINKGRFKMSDQLAQVFKNTQKELDW